MSTITATNVSKYYIERRWWQLGRRDREIGVQDVNLTIEQGEFVFVIGSSGAGKSTLLSLLAGQIKPSRGSVRVDGQELSSMKRRKPKQYSRTVGMVAQQHAFDRSVNVKKNLERLVRVERGDSEVSTEDRINKVLGLVGLPEAGDRFPGELTAGERRRVELAGAMINSPDILVLDEVIANLDEDSVWDTFLLLTEINRRGTTVIMSIHNSRFVNMLRRRVITLVDGRIFGDVDKGRYGEVAERKNAAKPLII